MSNSLNDSDILQEIPDEDLPALRDLYKDHWPFALHAYYWVDNYIDWKKRKITDIVFLCPEGRWDDGTFVAVEQLGSMYGIFVFTLEKSCERLRNALSKSSKIEWTKKNTYILTLAVHEAHKSTVIQEIENRQIKIRHHDLGNLFWMPKEETLKLEYEIPPEVYLAPLKASDVDIIDPVWPHHGTFSREYLLSLIVHNGGFGLYSKKDNSLCCWIMRNNYGGMAILQTAEEHKKKGYARIIAKHFTKYWGERGLDMFCFIMKPNKPSLSLFESLRFRKEHELSWFHLENVNSDEN